MKKILAVVGATGAQGGGLVRAILSDPNQTFSVRAITRNAASEKAKSLAVLGAEVVEADLDNVNSLEAAFSGVYGAFCVTNFWEHFSPEKELQQASNLATAAKSENVEHVIWSTLEDTRKWIPLDDDRMPTLQGKYKVPHFDAKGEADSLFTEAGVPVTFLQTSFYWENFIYFGLGPQRGPDGSLNIGFPMGDKKLPGIAVDDIGKCALGIFLKGNEFIGKTIAIAGEHLTGAEIADGISRATGQQIGFYAVDADTFRSFDFPGADDMGNMFQFKRDFEEDYCGARDLIVTRSLNPALKTFGQWLEENGKLIPIPEEVESIS